MRIRTLLAAVALPLAAVTLAAAQAASHKDITYPALPEFKVPKPEIYTLKNGMRVFLMEDHELPLIDVTARVRTGSWYEPADKASLAGLMADVQRSGGTKSMNGEALDEFLAVRAASIETSMGGDAGFASMNCLKENFGEVFPLFADVLRNPAFPQDKLDLAKVQANTAIARRNDDVGGITSREFNRLMRGKDSPLAREPEYATVAAVTRDDLAAWHAEHYHPNNVFLGVVGDFDSAAMKKAIEAAFGSWPKGPERKTVPPPISPVGPGVFYVEKTDVNQANISMGHPGGILVSHPDYFAVTVMNEVLGGSFASRLFSNVRSKKGLAYSVYGGLGTGFLVPGSFFMGMQTKSGSAGAGIDALKEEMRGMIDTPPAEAELRRAKESILNSFVFNYDSKEKILGQQMTYAWYGLPLDFLDRYRANIEKVTPADVARVARQYLKPDRLTILVVGNQAEFDRPLSSLGTVTPVDITIPAPPDSAPRVQKSAASSAAGAETWGKVVRKVGGTDFAKVSAVRLATDVQVSVQGMKIGLKKRTLLAWPDKLRQVQETPMGEQTVIVNGDRGIGQAGGQSQPLPQEDVAQVHKELDRELLTMVRTGTGPGIEVLAGGTDQVEGAACRLLEVTVDGTTSTLCAAEDGTVLRQTYQGPNPMTGAPAQVETRFGDWKAVGGRTIPFRRTVLMDGQEFATETVEMIEFDPTIEPEAFALPE